MISFSAAILFVFSHFRVVRFSKCGDRSLERSIGRRSIRRCVSEERTFFVRRARSQPAQAVITAMVDRTTYTDEAHTPKLALRQIFGRQGLKSELCVAAADAGLLSVEVFAMLGDTAAAAKTALRAIVPEHALGATGGERELGVMQLASVWLACQALQTQFATRRARMEEDPNKIPEMAQEDHAEFRARFVRSHPDVILIDAKEPHKKFVEKLNRDYLVNGMVPFYTMAEVRTRADNIVQKAGLTKNAEDLLTVAKAEEPDSVTDVNTLMNRIHAFFMALEYLNICQYSRGAGPLRYIQELEQFRTECPSLPFLQLADSLIRKKVYRLQAEQREVYSTYQLALQEVLTNHKYLWNDARTKAQLARSEHAKTVDTTDTSDRVQFDTPVKLAKKNKKKRKLERLQDQVKQLKTAHDKPRSQAAAAAPSKDKRIPESEWKAIAQAAQQVKGAKRCHYFNSSMGCTLGDKCRFKHLCMQCGSSHPMVGNH